MNDGGWWRFSATPATRTLKISAFYPKFSKNHEILSSLLQVVDIPQTTVQPSHKPFYNFLSSYVVLRTKDVTNRRMIKTSTEVNCNARHKDIKNKRILPQKQSKITNIITIRYQIYFRRQSNRHTNISVSFHFFVRLVFCKTKNTHKEMNFHRG